MTRITAAVYDKFMPAFDLDKVLRAAGVDSKIVIRCAVQVHPDHVAHAKDALRAEADRRALWPVPGPKESNDSPQS